ncbi:MAG: alpha/beta hydrolase fold protein [Rhodocyclaceae bacterium]|nr:MAG: alpha/beta hydrolase fold protein [Rhodocyclaceae bacterium]TNC99218.1 MAG: alpha/beta hydrolase fold protein [Rhodocyclaceae bacterium]
MTAQHYLAPRWLPGAHAQTIWPLLIKGPLPRYRRERWDTPDGDFIDLDWIDGKPGAPCVVLFHGLEGSSRSHYARRLMHAVERRGWHGVVMNFRGCSGEPNRLPRAYHSGDSQEIDWVLRRLQARGHPVLFAAGVSLGGNALLKWLAEQGDLACGVIDAAAAVSAPLDLAAANMALSSGFNLVYARHFLRTLIPAALTKDRRFPGHIDVRRARAARTLRDFDDAVTAPLHGFLGADDYYARSSAGPLLGAVRTPTLLLHAANDPFLPQQALPRPDRLPDAVRLEVLHHGGHVGFVHGTLPGRIDWLPQRLLAHFGAHLPASCSVR